MRIRRCALTVSSILFTFALLIPMPSMLRNAWTVPVTRFEIAGRMGVRNYYAPIGFASLAIIVIGLIVIWAGYVKAVRWTWFIMLLITWGWVFPVLVLPEFHFRNMLPIAQWPPLGLNGRGYQLGFAESVLTLVLMVLALVLPVKAFFSGQQPARGKFVRN